MMGLSGLVTGIAVAIGGMVQVAISQIGTALFDQKDISLEMLKTLKRQAGETLDEMSPSAGTMESTAAAERGPSTASHMDPNVRIYRGVEIMFSHEDKYWHTLGERYSTLGKAKKKIDQYTA